MKFRKDDLRIANIPNYIMPCPKAKGIYYLHDLLEEGALTKEDITDNYLTPEELASLGLDPNIYLISMRNLVACFEENSFDPLWWE